MERSFSLFRKRPETELMKKFRLSKRHQCDISFVIRVIFIPIVAAILVTILFLSLINQFNLSSSRFVFYLPSTLMASGLTLYLIRREDRRRFSEFLASENAENAVADSDKPPN
jgi:ABC-type nickel/cobalt efflux system permease component RcnA